VVATASANNQAFLKEIGADLAIDYRAHRFEEVAGKVDVVLDSIGGETQERSYQVLKPGGFLVSILQPPDPVALEKAGVRGAVILVKPNGAQLGEIAALIEAGKVKPTVSQTFELAQAEKAHESSKSGHTRGKLVLKVVE
jgi:NADPH:quinone reductase-like Zn-dependent oxidoreductase